MIAHPNAQAAASVRAVHDRMASNAPPRDPWAELWEAALAMAAAAYRHAQASGSSCSGPREIRAAERASGEAAAAYARTHTKLEACYAGIRVAFCTACEAPRRMSAPRAWEAEIVEMGGPAMTSECMTCGSTIRVEDKEAGR